MEDPFTFDSIDEIPNNYKFSYKDKNGHIYTFNGLELNYFINKVGKWNPYTREELSNGVLIKLQKFLGYRRLTNINLNEKYCWQTPMQSYTDVSRVMEKMGFYININWFLKFNLIIMAK